MLITITLLAFLVLLLVSLASLTRVETQVAGNAQNLARARQNALMALNIALGELQRTTGPDQRTTAVAAIGTVGDGDATTPDNGVPSPVDGTRQWVGVWGNAANAVNRLATTTPTLASHEPELPALLTWLVSGSESSAFTSSTTAANFGQLTAYPSAPSTLSTNAPWLTSNPSATTALSVTPSQSVTRVSTAGPLTTVTSPTEALRIGAGATARDAVLLVGPRTRGIDAGAPAGYVAAPLVDISVSAAQIPGLDPAGAAAQVGRYAWWVGDEGAKARADLQDPNQSETSGPNAIRRIQVAARTGLEALTGFSSWNPATVPADRLLSSSQLALVPSITPAVANARFNDVTTFSQGVLADVSRGGLKKDLTAGLLGSTVPAEIADAQPLFNFPTAIASTTTSPAPETLAWSGETPARLPSWGALRSYVRLEQTLNGTLPTVAPRQTTDTRMGIFPVVTRAQLHFHGLVEDNGGTNRVHALYFPAVVLWNPYNVTLQAHRYAFKFTIIDPYEGLNDGNWIKNNKAFPAFIAIHGPALNFGDDINDKNYGLANLLAVKGVSAYPTQDRGFPMVIDCPDLAPGETRIFTPQDSAPIDIADPAKNVLASGYRTTFFSEFIVSAPPGRTVHYLFMTVPQLKNYNCQRFALGLNAAFSGDPYFDPTELVQNHSGMESLALPTGSGQPNLRIDKTPAAPANPNDSTNLIPGIEPFLPLASGIATQTHTSSFLLTISGSDNLTDPYAFTSGNVPEGWTRFMNFSRPLRYYNTNSDNVNGFIKWLANDNPVAPETGATLIEEATTAQRGYFDNASFSWRAAASRKQRQNFYVDTPDLNAAYVGVSHGQRAGDPEPPARMVLYHLPRAETGTLSLGALQHAQVHPASGVRSAFVNGAITNTKGYVASAMPAYAIGNSLADPRVNPADIDGFPNNWNASAGSADLNLFGSDYSHNYGDSKYRRFHFDLSYLVNRALWDRYYFASTPVSGNLVDPVTNTLATLPDSRLVPYDPKNEQATAAFSSDLRDYDRAANRLMVKGAFNINSVSVEAWSALLASTRNVPIVKTTGTATVPADASPWPRVPITASEPLDNTGTAQKAEEADHFRALTPTETQALATEIVAEIKRRGPAVTLAGFVNRKPVAIGNAAPFKGNATVAVPAETALQRLVGYQSLMGPLQLAIDRTVATGASASGLKPTTATGINDRLAWPLDPPLTAGLASSVAASSLAADFHTYGTIPNDFDKAHNVNCVPFSSYIYRMAAAGYRDSANRTILVTKDPVTTGGNYDDESPISLRSNATASPGYLMQADLLQALAPVLSARSDTFRIRTYGEVKNPVTAVVEGRAWAEAVVQRLPDYVDQTDPALTAGANLGNATVPSSVNPANQKFGRRYQVVSFRWLSPDDI